MYYSYVLLVSSVCYALLCTFFLVHQRYKRRGEPEFGIVAQALEDSGIALDRRVTIALDLAKTKAGMTPWYEKAVSTIGVAGFISMIIATGIQTGDASAKKREVDDLKVEIARLEQQRSSMDQTLRQLSAGALEYYERTLRLDDSMRTLLELRRTGLLERQTLTTQERGQLVKISMILRRVEDAAAQVTIEPKLLSDVNAMDANSIAEYLIWMGDLETAGQVLEAAAPQLSTLEPNARAVYFALRAFVHPEERAMDVNNLSAVLKLSPAEASKWMSLHTNIVVSEGRDFKRAAMCLKEVK